MIGDCCQSDWLTFGDVSHRGHEVLHYGQAIPLSLLLSYPNQLLFIIYSLHSGIGPVCNTSARKRFKYIEDG